MYNNREYRCILSHDVLVEILLLHVSSRARCRCRYREQVGLASRMDSFRNDPSGEMGRKWRSEVEEKIEKWQELQTAKTKKALPKPDDMPARKRGGKRYVP